MAENAGDNFDDGTRMKELADAGAIKIGVKYDQPGLGFKDAASDIPTGFDVEMAKVLAASLGIDPNTDVEWVETISDNREPFLEDGTVDLVLASYSITDERRAVVGQAGPYPSPASSCWSPPTATSPTSPTSRARRSAR